MRFYIALSIMLTLIACGPKDEERILGKWYNEQHWFDFHNEKEYSGGVGPITNQENQSYVLEPAENKLTFYTGSESETYYVRYELIGEDTLSIGNFMNSTSKPIKYYRSNEY